MDSLDAMGRRKGRRVTKAKGKRGKAEQSVEGFE